MTKESTLLKKLQLNFPHKPTSEQSKIFLDLDEFILTLGNKNIFVLKGYAGTGKTTLISSLVKSLPGQLRFYQNIQIKKHLLYTKKYIG